jgi:3-phenylpropionate/trans-cinnamate dioxygenase ferredoxin component
LKLFVAFGLSEFELTAKTGGNQMDRFITVAKAKDISPGQFRLIHLDYQSIALFNVGGAFYATDEYCTGDGGSLSEGTLIGATIVCPADKFTYYLPTGECLDSRVKPLVTYAVHIEGEVIKIGRNEVGRKRPPVIERPSLNDWFAPGDSRI